MFAGRLEQCWKVEDATRKVAVVLGALGLSIRIFDPYSSAADNLRNWKYEVVRVRLVPFVAVELGLLTAEQSYCRERVVSPLLPNEPG